VLPVLLFLLSVLPVPLFLVSQLFLLSVLPVPLFL
jgi:hypothetical protein